MAYTETDTGSGIDKTFDNSYITRNELYTILDQLKETTRFYQLEVFEVIEIKNNTNDLLNGEVIGRYVFSEQGDSKEEIGNRTFLPLNTNIIQYPLRGELWLGLEYKGQQYYISRLSENINEINFSKFNESSLSDSITKDFSRGKYIGTDIEFTDVLPINASVDIGDTLLQGRFGNYINLSSNQSSGSDYIDSPKITINNKKSIIDLQLNKDFGSIDILSDTIKLNAEEDIEIKSNVGDVNIIADKVIKLKPTNSTIEFDISESDNGKIVNITKEGIPFPELDMAGFLKQVMGIQQFLQAMSIGVPKLSNPFTLPSGVKDIVKGLRGAKNFIDATINLEFLSQYLLETKTIQEIKAALPIPAGLGDIIDDVSNITPEQIKQLEDKVRDAKDKLDTAKKLQSQLSQVTNGQQALIVINNAGDSAKNIPGVQTIIDRAQAAGNNASAWENTKNQGGFDEFEDSISEYESTESDVNQVKSYKKLFDKYKEE